MNDTQADFIKVGNDIINLNQIAYTRWSGRTLYLNTSAGFFKVEGREASVVWALLEDRIGFDTATGEVKHAQR